MGKRLTDEEREWRSYSEKQFQSRVMKKARACGWMVAHFNDSRKMVKRKTKAGKIVYIPIGDKDAAGFPDLVLVRPPDILFWELKKELLSNTTSPEQDKWLDTLAMCGASVRVMRPSNWDEIVEILT